MVIDVEEETLITMRECWRDDRSTRYAEDWEYAFVEKNTDVVVSPDYFAQFTSEVLSGDRCYFDGKKDEPLVALHSRFGPGLSQCLSCAIDGAE